MNYGELIEKPHILSEEILEKRTDNSKTFVNPDGTFTWGGKIGAIHYKEDYENDTEWKEIDTTLVDMGDHFLMDKAPIVVKVYKDKVGYEITARRSGHKFTVELDGKNPDEKDVEFEFDVQSDRVRLWKTIKTNKISSLKWKITEENKAIGLHSLKFRENPEAIDLVEKDEKGDAKKVVVETSKTPIDIKSFYWEEKNLKSNLKIDTDVNYQVGASADDGYVSINSSTFKSGNDPLTYGNISGVTYGIWFRLLNVAVAQGSTISAAYFDIYGYSGAGSSINSNIYGNNADTATNPTTVAEYNGKAVTTAFVPWDTTAARTYNVKYSSPDIKDVIGEIIARGGWVSGNALMILHKNDNSGSSSRDAYQSYDESTTKCPKLYITYTAGGGGTTIPGLINVAGTWKQVSSMQIQVAGVWKSVSHVMQQVAGVWKNIF
jgi:hypothetical protein